MNNILVMPDIESRRTIITDIMRDAFESFDANTMKHVIVTETSSFENRIRHGFAMFNHLPTNGSIYLNRMNGRKIKVTSVNQYHDDIYITYNEAQELFNHALSQFLTIFSLIAAPVRNSYVSVSAGETPAQILAAHNMQDNKYFKIASAIDATYGKWPYVFRKLHIQFNAKGEVSICPVCNRDAVYLLGSDINSGKCGCINCGEHYGISLIARLKDVSLTDAADIVLNMLPARTRNAAMKRINAYAI